MTEGKSPWYKKDFKYFKNNIDEGFLKHQLLEMVLYAFEKEPVIEITEEQKQFIFNQLSDIIDGMQVNYADLNNGQFFAIFPYVILELTGEDNFELQTKLISAFFSYIYEKQNSTNFKNIVNKTNHSFEGIDFSSTPNYKIGYWPLADYRMLPHGMDIILNGYGLSWLGNLDNDKHPYNFSVIFDQGYLGQGWDYTYKIGDSTSWYQTDANSVRCVRE